MQGIPKEIYSCEFRDPAVRLHREDPITITEISSLLSLPKGTLNNWLAAAHQGKLKEIGKNQEPLNELELEMAKLNRELAEVKM